MGSQQGPHHHPLLPRGSLSLQRRFSRLQLHLSSSPLTASSLNLNPRTHSPPSQLLLEGQKSSSSRSSRHSRLSKLNLSSKSNSGLASPSSLNSLNSLQSSGSLG